MKIKKNPAPATGNTDVYEEPTTIFNSMFINTFIVNVVMSFGQFLAHTLIPKFADSLGASSQLVGIVSSMFTITALASKPISGPSIDFFPKKRVLCVAIAIMTASFVIYSLADNVATVMVARLIHGLGMGFTAPTCLALASDSLPASKMTQGISYFSLGQAMVSAAGPAIGLELASSFGYSFAFKIGMVAMAVAAVLAALMKTPPDIREKKTFRISFDTVFAKEATIPAVLSMLLGVGYSSIGSFLVLYAQNFRNVENIGLWFTVNAIVMLISRPLIGMVSQKYGIHRVLPPALILFSLSLLLISYAENITMFLVSAVICALGYGTCQPSVQALCMQCVSPERRGVGGSTNFIGTDTGFLAGPLIAGTLASTFGYDIMFRLMIIAVVFAFVFIIAVYPKLKTICMKS